MKKIPVIDLGRCTLCEGCIEVAPEVFRHNEATGYVEVLDVPLYPTQDVNEAIKICPEDCIYWDEE